MNNLSGIRALVLGGATGLLGQALVHALEDAGAEVAVTDRGSFDPLQPDEARRFVADARPEMVFNTIAHTQVDRAEDEPEAAAALNAGLPRALSLACMELGALLVHYSTDFVFDGRKEEPYQETDAAEPLSEYGRTKLRGELALSALGWGNLLILRTAWLFGPGKTNFVQKILGLAREREKLTVVHDQIGSPTCTLDLARHTLDLVRRDRRGLYHVANSGRASWCELAAEAVAAAGLPCRVEPIPTSAYPTRAPRPAFSVLDISEFVRATGVTPRPWSQALREYVLGLTAHEED
jgi:dTDP-4-dehydrorhamnose reductase